MRIAFDSGNQELNIVHINDLASVESSAYLLKFDSVHGTWEHDVDVENSAIVITHAQTKKKHIITYSQCPKVGDIPVQNADVKLVLESTGVFLTREKLQPYFDNGVAKVVVSAPVKDKENPVANIVYGVNHSIYDASKDHIVTAASCTTNCLAPVVKVIQEHLGIKHGCLTTVHDVTNTQSILDAPNTKKSDLRRARYEDSCCVFLVCCPCINISSAVHGINPSHPNVYMQIRLGEFGTNKHRECNSCDAYIPGTHRKA